MTKVKLVDGTVINAETVELVDGALKISTTELTVEELVTLFSDKNNTSVITLMTESDIESGIKTGFTSFVGINYGAKGLKTIELLQPSDDIEARIANAEANAVLATSKVSEVEEQNELLSITVDSILTEIIPSLMEGFM